MLFFLLHLASWKKAKICYLVFHPQFSTEILLIQVSTFIRFLGSSMLCLPPWRTWKSWSFHDTLGHRNLSFLHCILSSFSINQDICVLVFLLTFFLFLPRLRNRCVCLFVCGCMRFLFVVISARTIKSRSLDVLWDALSKPADLCISED